MKPPCHAAKPSRTRAAAGVVLPGVVLAVLPKCPACLAAYVGLATGLSLSASMAGTLRTVLQVAAIVALLGSSAFLLIRWRRWRESTHL